MSSSYKTLTIQLAKKLSGDFLGSFVSAFHGHGMEFVNLREYTPGDSIKKIDWKTTAKQHKTYIKNYQEDRDVTALFLFDLSQNIHFGSQQKTKLQTTKELFYLLSSSAKSSGFHIASLLGNTYLSSQPWDKNIILSLDYLDRLAPKSDLSLKKSIKITQKLKNQLIFVLSDSTEEEYLDSISRHNDVVYINIFDTLENKASWEDFLTHIWGMLTLFSKSKQQNYQKIRDDKLEILKNKLRKKHIRYLALDDQDNMFLCLYRFFKQTKPWNIS